MKRLILLVLVFGLATAGWWYRDVQAETASDARSSYRTATVARGDLAAQVSTTGSVSPITTVIVGSQLSGQIVEILVDYNSEVKTGQLLARLNSDQIRAKLDAARAELAGARAARIMLDAQLEKSKADALRADAVAADMRAQLDRSQTQLADAEKTLTRQTGLSERGIVSGATLQSARTLRDTLIAQQRSALAQIESAKAQKASFAADQKVIQAQMLSSEAQILQRAAMVRQIEVDLANSDIRAPVDGVVIQRNVELGQPVAASLQAPTLFLVAQDLRQIQIQANVDEADVGRVKAGQDVTFNVNAYPGRTFNGKVKLVRLGSQTVQNVVIYTTVVEVDNPRLELKPGMTANLRILTDQRDNVIRIPNAALRWRPPVLSEPSASSAVSEAVPATPAPAADDGENNPAGPFGARTARGGGRGLFVERIKADLQLNAEQQKALDALLIEMPDAGRTGGGGGGAQARAAFAEKVSALLTDEQKTKFAAMQERVRGSGGGGAGGAGGGRSRRAAAETSTQAIVTGRVYRLNDKNEPVGVPVRLGVNDGAFTEALSGVQEGDRLVIGGGAAPARSSSFRFGF